MKWITNIGENEVNDFLRKTSLHFLTVDAPKATETYTVTEFRRFGMVGIYQHEAQEELSDDITNREL